jgi:hypothetical protein
MRRGYPTSSFSGVVDRRWRFGRAGQVADDGVVDLAGDVALEAADDLFFGLAFGGAPGHVVLGALVPREAVQHDEIQGAVGLAVTAAVEAMPVLAAPR